MPAAFPANEHRAGRPPDLIWSLTVDQYHAMIEAGILTDDDPVELLSGWLVAKMPKNPRHRLATGLIREALERLVPDGWYVDSQEPVTTDDSEPEPDVMVVRGSRWGYRDRHPGPRDLALVVEVSDATRERDRTLKKRLYARAGIPVYMIVDLRKERIEILTGPSGPAAEPDYSRRHTFGPSDQFPVTIEGSEIGFLEARTLLALAPPQ
jgi:Uma2 family endonuclease